MQIWTERPSSHFPSAMLAMGFACDQADWADAKITLADVKGDWAGRSADVGGPFPGRSQVAAVFVRLRRQIIRRVAENVESRTYVEAA